jgi:hypothetical protein
LNGGKPVRKTAWVASGLLLIVAMSACSQERQVPIQEVAASYAVYPTFEELYRSAADIVEVRIMKDQQTFVTADTPFTVSQAEVVEPLKGSLRAGDIIPVVETGGIYTPYLNGDEKQGKQQQQVEFAIEGVRVMKPGEAYILFIEPNEKSSVDNAYNILGIFQGKYKMVDGGIERGASIGKSEVNFGFKSADELKKRVKQYNDVK